MKNIGNIQIFSHITFLDKLLFTKHLSIMIKSGITLSDALDILSSQTKSNAFKNVLKEALKDIRNGQTLAKALKKHANVFDHFYTSLIEVSEESGTLDENLEFLATQLAKQYALRKKIQGALLYPAIVLTAVTLVGGALSIFVLPKLVDLFESLDVSLPITTRILLFVASLMKDHGIIIVSGILLILIAMRFLIEVPSIKLLWHRVMFHLPILGQFTEYGQLASLCRNLGIMLRSGLPIRTALDVQYKTTTNLVFKDYIQRLQKSVNKGKGIEEELTSSHYSHFSPIAVKMIGVGEKTGKLDEIFLYLADFFEDEVDNAAKNLSTVLEPIILLVIGFIVGFVALSIISPIYQLTGSIKR